MFIGEAPGRNEDRTGIPFVGAAGRELNLALKTLDVPRDDVFITNLVKCKPPNNRNPTDFEIAQCKEHINGEIDFVNPDIICAMGRIPGEGLGLIDELTSIASAREEEYMYEGIRALVTYHPAYIARNKKLRPLFYEDIKACFEYSAARTDYGISGGIDVNASEEDGCSNPEKKEANLNRVEPR